MAIGKSIDARRERARLHRRTRAVPPRSRLPRCTTAPPKAAAAAATGRTRARRSSSLPSAASSRAAHTIEAFYLDKDELEEHDTGSRLWGVNYEFAPDEHTTLGATYMKWFADADVAPGRDGLNVFNLRAYTAPLRHRRDLSFEFEYASERNGGRARLERLDAAGRVRTERRRPGSRRFRTATRSSRGTIRRRRANEAFDPLFLGFYDWGTWWQGEIAGEYFLSNSNLEVALRSARTWHAERRRQRRADLLPFQRSISRGRTDRA